MVNWLDIHTDQEQWDHMPWKYGLHMHPGASFFQKAQLELFIAATIQGNRVLNCQVKISAVLSHLLAIILFYNIQSAS